MTETGKLRRRRAGYVIGAILVVAAAGFGVWELLQPLLISRKFDAAVGAYHARGERVLPEDFDQPKIADAENVATYLRRAENSIKIKPEQQDLWENESHTLPLRDDEMKLIGDIQSASPDVLPAVADARKRQTIYWQPLFDTQVIATYLNQMRGLATYLCCLARYEHQRRHDQAALQRVDDLFYLSRMIEHDSGRVAHLVSVGIEATGIDALNDISPDLKLTPELRPQIERTIGQLLVSHDISSDSWWAIERANPNALTRDPAKPGTQIMPAVKRAMLILWPIEAQIQNAAKSADYPAAMRVVNQIPEPQGSGASDRLVELEYPTFRIALATEYRICADRRLCATALAIHLYESDHSGQPPKALADLVPKYLPAIPNDPFSSDNSPLHYAAEKSILYSVDEDGRDDGGLDQVPTTNSPGDRVCYLKRPPRQRQDQ